MIVKIVTSRKYCQRGEVKVDNAFSRSTNLVYTFLAMCYLLYYTA